MLALGASSTMAEPASVTVTGGLASQVANGYECPGQPSSSFCRWPRQHRLPGTAGYVTLGYTKRTEQRRAWAFRFGPELTATMLDGENARASTVAASMNVGFHLYGLMLEKGLGLSMASFRGGDFETRSETLFLHLGSGIQVNRQWAITGRADVHFSGPVTVGTLGVGLTFSPGR